LSGNERFDLNNTLKSWIASPPDKVTINEKFQKAYEVPNVQNWIGFTNREGAVAVDHDDRRFWVYRSPMVKQPPSYYHTLAKAVAAGAGEFRGYLEQRDLTGF